MARPSTYQSKDDQDINIGENLWGLMGECMEMRFFENKELVKECFFEITPEQAEAIRLVLKGEEDPAAARKARLVQLIEDVSDPACADQKQQLCDLFGATATVVS